MRRRGLRSSVDAKCRDCIYDPAAKGNWRQQVTLCSSYSCPLWEIRPVSRAPIPQNVHDYYEVKAGDSCLMGSQAAPKTTQAGKGSSLAQGPIKATESDADVVATGAVA